MPGSVKGLCVWRAGWTGTATLTVGGDSVIVTPTPTDCALNVLNRIVNAANAGIPGGLGFSWAASDTGALTISVASSSFDLAMTGTTDTHLAFSSSSYSGQTSITTGSTPSGSFWPYTDDDGFLYTLDVRSPSARGTMGSGWAYWPHTPTTNFEHPVLRFRGLRAVSLSLLEKWESLGSPAKIDLYFAGAHLTTLTVGGLQLREESDFSGWSTVEFDVLGGVR